MCGTSSSLNRDDEIYFVASGTLVCRAIRGTMEFVLHWSFHNSARSLRNILSMIYIYILDSIFSEYALSKFVPNMSSFVSCDHSNIYMVHTYNISTTRVLQLLWYFLFNWSVNFSTFIWCQLPFSGASLLLLHNNNIDLMIILFSSFVWSRQIYTSMLQNHTTIYWIYM